MKKLLILLIAIIFCVSCCCKSTPVESTPNQSVYVISRYQLEHYEFIYKVKIEGHTYILWKGHEKGGIIHDPDCQCNKE